MSMFLVPARYVKGWRRMLCLSSLKEHDSIDIVGAMSFVSTPNADLARDGLAGAGGAVQGYGRSATSPEAAD